MKYIFVTGGVVSGLGKGITAASLGRLLKSRGLKVASQKLDPYINVDPGTMSPYQHGEVFVTEDGAETDLDLGHYERFIDEDLNRFSNLTTGKVYWNVLNKERRGEYLGENVISNFEKEYGVDVIVEYFDSNEMMYTKLQAGDAYDVIVPSDYMIQRLISEGSLQELDKSLIPNMDNLTDGVKNLAFDPDNTYSVPYFWGSVGIVYNKNNVPKDLIEEKGFEILRDTDYAGDIYMYDSERDSFMVALKALGYSMNTTDDAEIEEAYQWLLELNKTMNPAYVTDEVIDNMMNGTKDIAVVYSGDATVILDENEDMDFFMPSEGTNIWCDSMCIPTNAEKSSSCT